MSNTVIKKTNRKNKTNLQVNWSKMNNKFFTIGDLLVENPQFIDITLRSHVNAAKKDNVIDDIGCIHNGKGRPKLVFTTVPVSKQVLEAARQAGVLFNERYDSIAVVNVDAVQIPSDEQAQLAAEDEQIEVLNENSADDPMMADNIDG